MIINSITDIQSQPLFYSLDDFIQDASCYIKLEGMNIAGSIKIKTALWLMNSLEKQGKCIPGKSTIVCSSSGNLAIALSIVCKEKNYPIICVSDMNISPISEKFIKLLGGQLIKIQKADANGGFLESRLKLIQKMLTENSHYVFVDQYNDHENINAHFSTTAQEIIQQFPKLDYLFIGAGTTGTLMGCAHFYKKYSPHTKIIAVDAKGSVTFGTPAAKRYIPGLGTSFKPGIADINYIDDILLIDEIKTIQMCHHLLKTKGLFLGGSSGTVLQGVKEYKPRIKPGSTIVAISPDFGDRYLNTIYDTTWLKQRFELEPA